LRQGTLSFASAKRSGSSGAKDSLKGKAAASSVEPPAVAPIRVGGKRKYEPEPEPEHEEAQEATEALERDRLDTEDSRWNKAYGQARAKMGNLQPGPSSAPSSFIRFRLHRVSQFMRRTNHRCTTSCASLTCT
jgi:DNA polymerase delta subunit 4